MTVIELKYDAFKAETILLINGAPSTLRCFGTGENVLLSTYINGFFPEMVKKISLGPGAECGVKFYGTIDNYEDIINAHKKYCEENKEITINKPEYIPYPLKDDSELLEKIEVLKNEKEKLQAEIERLIADEQKRITEEEAEAKRQAEEKARLEEEERLRIEAEKAALEAQKEAEPELTGNQKPLTFERIAEIIPSDGDEYVISVKDDITLAPTVLDFGGKRVTVIIRSVGLEIKSIQLTSVGSLFTVNKGVTLILQKITLIGLKKTVVETSSTKNESALIQVMSGNLFINEGASITGNSNPSGNGGGVYIAGKAGKVTIDGGVIKNNLAHSGGGLFVAAGCVLTMLKGSINDNTAKNGGGVFIDSSMYSSGDSSGFFNMKGGVIKLNSARNQGGGVFVQGAYNSDKNGRFLKQKVEGCIIYGNGSNNASQDGYGHAVALGAFSNSQSPDRHRDTIVQANNSMDSTQWGEEGGWEYI